MRRMPRWSLLLLVLSVLALVGTAWGVSVLTLESPGEGEEVPGPGVTLEWSLAPGSGDVTEPGEVYYDVYLANRIADLVAPIVSLSADTYEFSYPYAGPLEKGKMYFWRVIAHLPSGDVQATSYFRTVADPGALSLVAPVDKETGVARKNTAFKWEYDNGTPGEPDPGNVSFDLYISGSQQNLFDDSSRVGDDQLVVYTPATGIYDVGLNLSDNLGYDTKYYWTVLVHLTSGDYTVYPHSFTTLAEADDPNASGGCSAVPLGGLVGLVLLSGLVLVKRRR